MKKLLITFNFCLFTFSFFLLPFPFLFAQWSTTPDSALFVDFGLYPYLAVDENDQSITMIYIANADRLLAKKYDRYGDPLWGGNAVVLADTNHIFGLNLSNLGNQWGAVISDDSGGAVICWKDFRHSTFDQGQPINNEIYIQRVDANGQVCYGTNGRRISTPASAGWHELGDMKPDYHGGFLVAFDNDSTSTTSVLKRISINGSLIWETYFTGAYIDIPATDREGNIFVNTIQYLPGARHKLDLYGNNLWPDTLTGMIPGDAAFPDRMNGVIGGRFLFPNKININRIDSIGQFVFGDSGIILSGISSTIGYSPDNVGGIYVSWTTLGSRVQRINQHGIITFASGGVIVADDSTTIGSHRIVSYNKGGVISVWADKRNWPIKSFYAQRIDSTGQLLWDSLGLELHSTSQNPHFTGPAIPLKSDGRGGAIFIWVEQGQGLRIMLKQISKNGNLGEIITLIKNNQNDYMPKNSELYQNYPNPFNPVTTITYQLPVASKVRLEIYNILGQKVRTLVDAQQPAEYYTIQWDGKNDHGRQVGSGLYIYRLITETADGGERFVKARKMLLIR